MKSIKLSRRALLKTSLAIGAGLTIGFELPVARTRSTMAQTPGVFTPNQWLSIDRDAPLEQRAAAEPRGLHRAPPFLSAAARWMAARIRW